VDRRAIARVDALLLKGDRSGRVVVVEREELGRQGGAWRLQRCGVPVGFIAAASPEQQQERHPRNTRLMAAMTLRPGPRLGDRYLAGKHS
jgi:hypothetical protein